MPKLFIVEDDSKIREELSKFLSKNGYEIENDAGSQNIVEKILNSSYDLVLLDINLPGVDGYYICKELRKHSQIPIIIVTSKNTEMDELMSMNLGADDFITKPYHVQILLARIESVLRRSQKKENNATVLVCGKVKVDISKSIVEVDGVKEELTKNEVRTLDYLIKHQGTIISREDLMNYLWDSYLFVDDNTLTVNVNRLRKKLEDLGVKDFIKTMRGQGYIVDEC